MKPAEVERLIESNIDGANATVTHARDETDDDHLAATVVAPAFEGASLVEQHDMVYEAVGEHMTTDIHALEVSTYTPAEYDDEG